MIVILLKRDLKLAFFSKGYFFNSLALFVITTTLLTFIMQTATLSVMLLPYIFASLLAAPEIFQEDNNDSTLDQLIAAGHPSYHIVIAKLICHLFQSLIILVLAVPILCFIYNIALDGKLFYIYLTLLALAFSVSSLVTFASGLTLRINNGIIITCLIVMPLILSILLYTASILNTILASAEINAMLIDFKIMMALSFITSIVAVLACSYNLTKI